LFLLSINDCIFDPNQMQIWSFIWNKLSILSFHKIASEFLCESLLIVLVLRLKLSPYRNSYRTSKRSQLWLLLPVLLRLKTQMLN
jgi:hypothetical protein